MKGNKIKMIYFTVPWPLIGLFVSVREKLREGKISNLVKLEEVKGKVEERIRHISREP